MSAYHFSRPFILLPGQRSRECPKTGNSFFQRLWGSLALSLITGGVALRVWVLSQFCPKSVPKQSQPVTILK